MLNEKYDKMRLKEIREYWFYKSRRKKKRRKLCRYYFGKLSKEFEGFGKIERSR